MKEKLQGKEESGFSSYSFGLLILIFKDYFTRCTFHRNQRDTSWSSVGRNPILVPFGE